MNRSPAWFAATLCAVAFAQEPHKPYVDPEHRYDAFPQTGKETEQMLLKRFPLGTRVAEVEAYLMAQEFRCTSKGNDEAFGERARAGSYRFCERVVPYGFLVGLRWQVALVKDGRGRLDDLFANYAMIGR